MNYIYRANSVQAIQWNGLNIYEVAGFLYGNLTSNPRFVPRLPDVQQGKLVVESPWGEFYEIPQGDWIIKDIAGEHYPMRNTTFQHSMKPAP